MSERVKAGVVKAEVKARVKAEVKAEVKVVKAEEGGKIKFEFKKVKLEEPEPFAAFARPLPEECRAAVQLLGNLHGTPTPGAVTMPVLDSLVRTILSQNTTDKNSRQAFASLKIAFPTWRQVHEAECGLVEESIKFGGLAEIKTRNIQTILAYLLQEHADKCPQGEPSYEWLREMPTSACKAELAKLKGVGPKTVSCVLMFNMQRPEFPVDTHVWHIAKMLRWVPHCTAESCYAHLNRRVPDECKYALHVLLVEHGKRCTRCAKGGKLQLPEEGNCPLLGFEE
ncbi:DNA glycosylase, partial [Ochromonadaceae sp. CCMP2298]